MSKLFRASQFGFAEEIKEIQKILFEDQKLTQKIVQKELIM